MFCLKGIIHGVVVTRLMNMSLLGMDLLYYIPFYEYRTDIQGIYQHSIFSSFRFQTQEVKRINPTWESETQVRREYIIHLQSASKYKVDLFISYSTDSPLTLICVSTELPTYLDENASDIHTNNYTCNLSITPQFRAQRFPLTS